MPSGLSISLGTIVSCVALARMDGTLAGGKIPVYAAGVAGAVFFCLAASFFRLR